MSGLNRRRMKRSSRIRRRPHDNDCRKKAGTLNVEAKGASEIGVAEDGQCLYARIGGGGFRAIQGGIIRIFHKAFGRLFCPASAKERHKVR